MENQARLFESFQRNATAGGIFDPEGQGHTDSRVECRLESRISGRQLLLPY
jgi:hypothetical protein